jgi:hypothetical protein
MLDLNSRVARNDEDGSGAKLVAELWGVGVVAFAIATSWCLALFLSRNYRIKHNCQASVKRLVRTIRRRRGGIVSLPVVACPDDIWQEAMRSLLNEADAVIFDSSVLTDALSLEFRWALDNMGPFKIIVATPSGLQADDPNDRKLRQALRQEFGFDFDYVTWISHSARSDVRKLSSELQGAIAQSLVSQRRRPKNNTKGDSMNKEGTSGDGKAVAVWNAVPSATRSE